MNGTNTQLTTHPARTGRPPKPVILDQLDKAHLEEMVGSGYWPEAMLRKVKAILALAEGNSVCDVAAQLNYSEASIRRCRMRFRHGGTRPT